MVPRSPVAGGEKQLKVIEEQKQASREAFGRLPGEFLACTSWKDGQL